jgi:hypothetical protein
VEDLEKRLRCYRPAGPPPELRDRVMLWSAREPRTLRDWLLTLAAAAAVVLFYVLASHERTEAGALAANTAAAETRQAMLSEIAAALGGDEVARAEAQRLIEQSDEAERLNVERAMSAYGVFAHD